MIRFILAILCLVAFLIAVVVRRIAATRMKSSDISKYELENAADTKAIAGAAAVVLLVVTALVAAWSMVRIVPANAVGIPVTFGKVSPPIDNGFHFVAPWTDISTFSTRVQESSMLGVTNEGDRETGDAVEVRGSDGYEMEVDITIRYYITESSASDLFKLVGSEDGIRDRLVRPEARESVRVQFAKYTAEEGYTTARESIRSDIEADLAKRLERYGLRLDTVNVRNVAPDATLSKAISDRAAAREKALQAEIEQQTAFTQAETQVGVAERAADAKRAEAAGIADANEIVQASLTPDILELRRIEALSNANTIYVPADTSIIAGSK